MALRLGIMWYNRLMFSENNLLLQYLKTRRCKYYTLVIVYNDTVLQC